MDAFTRQALNAHNKVRAQHNVPPLGWSTDLERSCQAWAKKIAKQNKLQHASDLNGIGENIFMTSRDSETLGTEATKSWYSEIKKYNFSRGGYQGGTGHFTQVVWKSSAELGIAKAKSPNGNVFIVARYSPGGNDLNKFGENVLPPNTSNPMQVLEGDCAGEEKVIGERSQERRAPSKKVDESKLDAFTKQALNAHNKARAQHDVPPLGWSTDLERSCQAWAKKIAMQNKLQHASDLDGIGENIFMTSRDSETLGTEATKSWYSEIKKYNFSRGGYQGGTGHFTQVVWKSSAELGIAKAKSPNGNVFIVARYSPGGNDLNKFGENVLPPNTSNPMQVLEGDSAGEEKINGERSQERRAPSQKVDESKLDAFTKQALNAHNKARAQHNVPPLGWSTDLERSCQAWAKKIAMQNKLQHASDLDGIGENIFMTSRDSETLGTEATKSWYSEIKKYNFSRGGYQGGTGHFTQVVWKSSAELGIAKAKSPNGNVFIVARYSPGGNDLNKFGENVLPPNTSNPMQVLEGDSAGEEKINGERSQERRAPSQKVDESKLDAFTKQALNAHNKARAQHNVAPLGWSTDLERSCQAWAKKIAMQNKLQHASDLNGIGENIFMTSRDSETLGTEATKSWYSEIKKYNFSRGGYQGGTGHFTQVVWKSSAELGIAKAKSPNGNVFIVARYSPGGNDLNKFGENVLPPNTSNPMQVLEGDSAGEEKINGERSQERRAPSQKVDESKLDAFTKQALNAHNKVRAQHNVPPLGWSTDLERSCQAWVKKIAKQNKLQHADDLNGIGENIFMTSRDSETLGTEATKSWYSEIKKYNFIRGGYQGGTGHFTQVVWKSSAELGIAKAKSPDGNVFIVARYSPGGNDLNKFDKNVLLPNTSNPLKIFDGDLDSGEEKANGRKLQGEAKEKKAQIIKLNDSMIDELVVSHNGYRALHDAPPVTWSEKMADEAQQFAEELARTGNLGHASKEDRKYQGENICRMSKHYKLTDAVSFWYAEIGKYDFSSPGFSVENGHFTQVVWRKTREIGVGCARSEGGDGLVYMVARYWPPGNVTNDFEQNVLPPLSS